MSFNELVCLHVWLSIVPRTQRGQHDGVWKCSPSEPINPSPPELTLTEQIDFYLISPGQNGHHLGRQHFQLHFFY